MLQTSIQQLNAIARSLDSYVRYFRQIGFKCDDIEFIVESQNDAEKWNRGDAGERKKNIYHFRGTSIIVYYAVRQVIARKHVSENEFLLTIPEMIAAGNLHASFTNGVTDVGTKLKDRYGSDIYDLVSRMTPEKSTLLSKRNISIPAIKERYLNRLTYFEQIDDSNFLSGVKILFLADRLQGYECEERREHSGMSSTNRMSEAKTVLFIARQADILFDELLDAIARLGSKHIYSLTQ